MVQFNGKWPFHRFEFGPVKFQEPLSVLFSLGNLLAHYAGWRSMSRRRRGGAEYLRKVYRCYAITGINTWIWSAVFHTRDVDWTEKADYISAAGGMLAGLWMAGIRLSGLYVDDSARLFKRIASYAWALFITLLFIAHCRYLTSGPRFDYDYNMRFNVVIALTTIALWACWSAYHRFVLPPPSRSPTGPVRAPHAHRPLLPLLALPALSALELLDFAPIGPFGLRLLDAHALWHASTIPVVFVWYNFLRRDLDWIAEGENGGRIVEEGGRRRLD